MAARCLQRQQALVGMCHDLFDRFVSCGCFSIIDDVEPTNNAANGPFVTQ